MGKVSEFLINLLKSKHNTILAYIFTPREATLSKKKHMYTNPHIHFQILENCACWK